MLKLGLNDRERKKFAEFFGSIATSATAMALGLGTFDDIEITLGYTRFVLLVSQLNELHEIIKAAIIEANATELKTDPAKVEDEFPSIIGG